MSEKTEEPTEHRVRQARRDGRIAKSKDLTQALAGCIWPMVLSAIFLPAMAMAGAMLGQLMSWIGDPSVSLDEQQIYWSGLVIRAGLMFSVGAAVIAMVSGIALELIQTKGLISIKPIVPAFDKLNPASQIKSMFSMRTIVELFKGIAKVIVISAVALLLLRHTARDIAGTVGLPLLGTLAIMGFLLLLLSIGAQLFTLALAVLDVLYQKYEHRKSLRMSKDEVQREFKEQEGDPMIKGERRRLHHEALR